MKILIVDDEPQLAASLRKGLTADGFTVEVASDGENGLWMVKNQTFDAIVLDIMLPKLTGYEVCATLRKASNWTPILMLTAKDGDQNITSALDMGADDYLTKPFSLVVLSGRIRALTRRGATDRPTDFVVDDLRLDVARRRCRRGDNVTALTPKEFNILELLCRRARRSSQKADCCSCLDHQHDEVGAKRVPQPGIADTGGADAVPHYWRCRHRRIQPGRIVLPTRRDKNRTDELHLSKSTDAGPLLSHLGADGERSCHLGFRRMTSASTLS